MQQLKAADEETGKTEFKLASKKWCLYGNSLSDDKWRMLYPQLQKERKLDMVEDLMPLSFKPLMEDIIHYHDNNDNCFGYLPIMLGCSRC